MRHISLPNASLQLLPEARAKRMLIGSQLQGIVWQRSGYARVFADHMAGNKKPTVAARYQFSAMARTLARLEHNNGKEPGRYFTVNFDHSVMCIVIAGFSEAFKYLVVTGVQLKRPPFGPSNPSRIILLPG
jgi:hypothetical protein